MCSAVLSTEIIRPTNNLTTINLDSSDDESTPSDVIVVSTTTVTLAAEDEETTEVREALNGVLSNIAEADLEYLRLWKITAVHARHSCVSAPPTKPGQKATPFDPSMFIVDCLDQVFLLSTTRVIILKLISNRSSV